ncbi:hypothetical protein [Mycolicibacterium fortuitum]|uniref:Uncharacterized protein n=2 Tax=Mycolicibacterium fortuitum TaxID=1766 RepID=A0AAE4VF34_MYCFO|nr:hypothetical protein [Mycolicibacterium fortuitum]MCV7142563.1 hypothetical protein [Mycolicibacterium fortuitum]MDV7193720.1 hypothetical protein [Mycolicibacterium fortuitum]MDV7207129.1 hypothetical protein [Mycolicibacterium fortuitum]MDV7228640.1 hypothetical protein [Mycolicibacterium fortuitum]MDV7260596.1 hypothetical protein [Mycolicibacterium fortuitum]
MTTPAALLTPASWVPDYLHGPLRRWKPPQVGSSCRCRRYEGDQVIHCVGRVQHLLDVAFGRPPRSRCGVRLVQAGPTALLEDGAPLCPACAAITHPPAAQVEAFNHRGDDRVTAR